MENLNNELYTHPIAVHKLNKSERSVLAKLKKNGIYNNSAMDIICLDDKKLDKYKNLISSEPSLKPLIFKLKDKILNSPDCIRKFIAPISFSSIQRELLEVLEYRNSLKKKDQELFEIFIYEKSDVKNYQAKNNLKETAIQRLKNGLLKELRTVLLYSPSRYRNYLKNNDSHDMKLEMPELYSRFQSDTFYKFIKNIFDFEEDFEFQKDDIDDIDISECFNDIFQEIALPCTMQVFRNSFYEIIGLNYAKINTLMPKIEAQGLIEIKDKKVVSAKLQFKTAMVQVLLQSNREMSWKEMLESIKENNLFHGKAQLKQDFDDSLGLYDSIIKASNDTYIHVKNSNLTFDTIDKCIDIITNERKRNPMITLDKLQAKINMPISVFEIEHILNKM
ncbi:MAG: hypothetical protein ACOX3T_03575 [Bdellovibrionota bacterium]